MTSILTRYLMRSILMSSALVLIVLLALAALFEFIAELDDVRNGYRTPQVVLYTLLRLPNLAFEMMPVAVLIGSLLGLGALASHSEIIVMRAAGYSVRRMAGMVALTGLMLLALAALLGEFVGPPLDFYARDMRAKARYGDEDDRVADATWVRDGSVFLHLERVSPEFEFGAVYLYRFNDDHSLESIARADDSGIGSDDRWMARHHEPGQVIDRRRRQQQRHEQRVRPAVEEIARERQDEMTPPFWRDVVQQQDGGKKPEEKQIRAENHVPATVGRRRGRPAVGTPGHRKSAAHPRARDGRRSARPSA